MSDVFYSVLFAHVLMAAYLVKVRSDGGDDRCPRVPGFPERVDNFRFEMAILHGHHVGNILHYEGARPQNPHDTHELLVKAVSRIVHVAGADLAETLARGAAVDHIDLPPSQFGQIWHAGLLIAQKAGNVALEERDLTEVAA